MGEPRYIVLFGACLTQFTVIGMLFSFGLFLPSFEAELGWSRTFLSTCTALAFFVMGTLSPLIYKRSSPTHCKRPGNHTG